MGVRTARQNVLVCWEDHDLSTAKPILCRLRETGNKMLHKRLPNPPPPGKVILLFFYTALANTVNTLRAMWWIPSGWDKAQGSGVKCICQRHWLFSCFTCWLFLHQTLSFPRIFKKNESRSSAKIFSCLKNWNFLPDSVVHWLQAQKQQYYIALQAAPSAWNSLKTRTLYPYKGKV